MKPSQIRLLIDRHSPPLAGTRLKSLFRACGALIGFGLLAGTLAQAEPVNLLWVPCTNNAPGITTLPSNTALGGVGANLTMVNNVSPGVPTDLVGKTGSGVNGVATGATALCLTNLAGGVQPASGNGERAVDTNDVALGFGTLTSFVVTMWINQLATIPANIGPRLFVLNAGAPAADATANSLSVKMQANNEWLFEINTIATLGAVQSNPYPAGKWLFFAWVYDGTNLYEYDGSDSQVAHLASTAATANQSVNLGASASLMLGNRGSLARGLDGWMEDFRLYNGFSTNNLNFVENIRKQIAPKIPTITGVYPDGMSLLQATNTLVFTASSASGLNLTNIDLKLNSVDVSSSCTFVTNGTGVTNVTVSYTGLQQQGINTVVMSATDALGLSGSSSVTFDTFSPTNFIVKAEEFDYGGGQFIDNPDYTNAADPNSYFGLDSMEGIDTHKGGAAGVGNDVNCYRATDGAGTRTQTPLSAGELPSPTRFGGSVSPSHMVGNWSSGEWQNYTKTFPAGNYNVYARLTTSSGSTINLDQVLTGQGTSSQTLSRLGNFTYTGTGAFQWVPLLQNGSLAVVNLSGTNTFRATTGGGANADFYMLVPANPNLPLISSVYPDGNYLFEATNKLVFTVSSAAGINTTNVTLTLNGTNLSSSLVFSGGPNTWNASYTGLHLNQTYATVISITDSNGFSANATLNIDTWNPVLQVESEDFDFDPALSPVFDVTGNRYIDNPTPTAPGVAAANSYEGQTADTGIDDGGGASAPGHADYRSGDTVATTPVTDLARRQFVNGAVAYNIGFLAPGMWEQYTRTWPAGTFNVYARVASGANIGTIYSSWSEVIAGWGTVNQVTRHVGTYGLPSTGGYSSYLYAPLLDRFGNYANLALGGTNTFRDTHITFNQTETANGAAFGLNINFYMLLAARADLPRIDAVYPDGTTPMQQTNAFSFVADNVTYGISTNNIHLTLNGVNITNLIFSGSSTNWNVSYPLQPNLNYTAVITITDNNNQTHTTTVNFDTFSASNFTWEAEDFDFDPSLSQVTNNTGLRFIDNPVLTSAPSSNSYYGQQGDLNVDYSVIGSPLPTIYRPADYISLEATADSLRAQYLNAQLAQVDLSIQDYDIFDITNGWINYTRTFPAGNFHVYARLSAGGTTPINFQLGQVTNGAGTSIQASNVLGNFAATGNAYATWQYVQLVNTNTGQPVVVQFTNGVQTLQIQGDGSEHVNFFMLVSVPPNSVAITSSVSGTNVLLSFPTQTGYTYTMYYKNNLNDPTWTPVVGGGNPVTGNNAVQSVTDSLGQSHRFYRLSIQ